MRTTRTTRRLTGVAAAALATGTLLALPSNAHAATTWIRINAFHSNLVAQVLPPWTTNNLAVEQRAWGVNTWNGQWKMIPKGVGGQTFQFENRYSHQCLDVLGDSTAEGAAVVQNPCDNHLSQQWTRWTDPVLPVWHNYNRHSGKYLAVANGSVAPGARFVQSGYTAGAANEMMQIW